MVTGSKICAQRLNAVLKACHTVDSNGALRLDLDRKRNSVLREAQASARREMVPEAYIQRMFSYAQQGFTHFVFHEYDTNREGKAYQTVSGQNSNNSVRIPNEFFAALEADGDWQLKRRTKGKVCKTIKARELWDRNAWAAWTCADPGTQYDTTINEWHTCPEDGRINASNPCSEYMFLDDTACNLASLNLMRAEVELARAKRLDERKLVAESQVEDAGIALDQARAQLEKARKDAAVVETELSYAVIRSPITGTVASVTTQEGETVAASFNTPTFATIIEDGALELIAMVDETDIGNVVVGNPVTFTVEAYPAQEFEGRVSRIAPKGTIISGVVNFEVMIRIDSSADVLKPDMTANVTIRTAEREALVVPSAAVQREGSERYVWVEKDGELTRRAVTVGTRDTSFTEIRQGVGPGERVLVAPQPQAAGEGQGT